MGGRCSAHAIQHHGRSGSLAVPCGKAKSSQQLHQCVVQGMGQHHTHEHTPATARILLLILMLLLPLLLLVMLMIMLQRTRCVRHSLLLRLLTLVLLVCGWVKLDMLGRTYDTILSGTWCTQTTHLDNNLVDTNRSGTSQSSTVSLAGSTANNLHLLGAELSPAGCLASTNATTVLCCCCTQLYACTLHSCVLLQPPPFKKGMTVSF